MLQFWWSWLRRHCGDGVAAIDEAIIEEALWRWRTGQLNRRWMRDVELLRWTTSSGKRLRLGSGDVADGGGWVFAAGAERLWRPGISNGEKEAMGRGNHHLGTRLSKM